MTPTEEINKWIAIHGSERDALNVALARLTANAERIRVLLAEHEALRDARSRWGNCDCDACRAWKTTEAALKGEPK